MAFKMKGSAFKLGNVATKSTLKQASPVKDTYPAKDRLKDADLQKKMEKHNAKHAEGWDHDEDQKTQKDWTKTKSPLERKSALKTGYKEEMERVGDKESAKNHAKLHKSGYYDANHNVKDESKDPDKKSPLEQGVDTAAMARETNRPGISRSIREWISNPTFPWSGASEWEIKDIMSQAAKEGRERGELKKAAAEGGAEAGKKAKKEDK